MNGNDGTETVPSADYTVCQPFYSFLLHIKTAHSQQRSALNHFTRLRAYLLEKKTPQSLAALGVLVDDTGLEPVTSRTSSGCSTS